MKKFLVSLTLVGLIGLLTLASLAFSPGHGAISFEANGDLTLDPESLKVVGAMITPTGAILQITGEHHAGTIFSEDWDLINNQPVTIDVVHEEAVFNFGSKTFRSHIGGQIKIGPLSGTLTGTVTGAFPDFNEPLPEGPDDFKHFVTVLLNSIATSEVNVSWQIQDDGVVASGKASASFSLDLDGEEFSSDDLSLHGMHRD